MKIIIQSDRKHYLLGKAKCKNFVNDYLYYFISHNGEHISFYNPNRWFGTWLK